MIDKASEQNTEAVDLNVSQINNLCDDIVYLN